MASGNRSSSSLKYIHDVQEVCQFAMAASHGFQVVRVCGFFGWFYSRSVVRFGWAASAMEFRFAPCCPSGLSGL